jgi:transposase
MRGLIHEVAEGTGARIVNPMLARLKRACKLHRDDEAEKVRALAREILNDWAAITAFVTNPDLPATNNEAERALRDAVIARRISNGNPHRGGLGGLRRHSERLGDLPPPRCRTVALHHRPAGPTCWTDLLARARKGLPHPTIPLSA